MLPNREGLFHAYPAEVGVDETGPNNLTTAIVRFRLFEELKDGQWSECFDESLEIVGYFYLECRDGSLNSITLDSLKNALGWDGRDPFWLQETNLSEQGQEMEVFVELWHEAHGPAEVTATDLMRVAEEHNLFAYVFSRNTPQARGAAFGKLLRRHVDAPIGESFIRQRKGRQALYRLEAIR